MDRIMNSCLSPEARSLHHNCGMAFASVPGSRSSMAAEFKSILKVKTRFSRLSGVRFHQTAANGMALLLDEVEVRFIGQLPSASDHAKAVASMMTQPTWATVCVEASVPLLLWTTKLNKLIEVSLVEKTT